MGYFNDFACLYDQTPCKYEGQFPTPRMEEHTATKNLPIRPSFLI